MFSGDILDLCREVMGEELEPPAGPDIGVVEKTGSAQASDPETPDLLTEIDEALGGAEQKGTHTQDHGKIALASLLAAGDILANGRS